MGGSLCGSIKYPKKKVYMSDNSPPIKDENRSRFLLEHAEKSLMATIADAEALTQNCIYVAGVYLVAMSACGAILVQQDQGISSPIAAIISGAYLILSAYRFAKSALVPRDIQNPGNLAEHLTSPVYAVLPTPDLIELEAQGYDERIKKNSRRNKATGKGLRRGILELLAFPLVFLVVWICSQIISSVWGFR